MRPVLNDLYQDYLDKIDVAFEVEEDETIVGLVAQNFGIAILPRFDFLKMADIEVIEIDALKGKRILYMAYKKNQFHSPALKEFISFVENSIEDTNS
jgi:DNA-binding transcriptional LysR family regulator